MVIFSIFQFGFWKQDEGFRVQGKGGAGRGREGFKVQGKGVEGKGGAGRGRGWEWLSAKISILENRLIVED